MSELPPVTPASVQVPADAGAPVIVDFTVHAIRLALVEREPRAALADEWAQPGVYVLLGHVDGGPMSVYVGRATRLRDRLQQHRRDPRLDWWRAVLIRRDNSAGFNSAEIGYLEGRLASELGARPGIALLAGKRDQDDTLPDHLLLSLDALLPTIFAGLRVAGVPIHDEDEVKAARKSTRRPKRIEGSVADLLAAGLLSAGARLVFRRAGKEATATVAASGGLIVNGVTYDSPSMAGKEAFGLRAVNGWDAWHLADREGVSLADLRAQLN